MSVKPVSKPRPVHKSRIDWKSITLSRERLDEIVLRSVNEWLKQHKKTKNELNKAG